MHLYNPKNGAEYTTVSDDEAHVAVYLEAGWQIAPEPEAPEPGFMPEPVVYAPIKPESGSKQKRTTSTKKDESTD